MPELPEVETMRRALLPSIGMRIVSVRLAESVYRPLTIKPSLEVVKRAIEAQTIVAIDRLGKRVVVRTTGGWNLVLHPRMSGIVLMEQPPNTQHVRLVIELALPGKHVSTAKKNREQQRIIFWDQRGLGVIELWSDEQKLEYKTAGKLGPDALEISESAFFERFSQLRREVKPSLLDQSLVAGIGNLYASEILHRARVHPKSKCNGISKKRWSVILAVTKEVLNEAIASKGSTLSDGTYRTSNSSAGSYQNRHRVYDRATELCGQCGTGVIERIVQAQRSTFYCRVCQRKVRSIAKKWGAD